MKILYLYARHWYETKMSPGRILYGQAIATHPGVRLHFSGLGWPDWDSRLSVSQNIDRMGLEFDAIWVYKPQDYFGLLAAKHPKVITFNEANDPRKTWEEIQSSGASVIIFHHENDLFRWKDIHGSKFHIPHCACIDTLRPRPKSVECFLSGATSKRTYPIRYQLSRMVKSGAIPGVARKHPGYDLTSNQEIHQQYEAYAEQLSTARIALCCSSIHKYALAKLFEASACGCVIATDMPDDSIFRNYFGERIISLNGDPRHDKDAILAMLADESAMNQIGDLNRKTVEDSFSLDQYAARFVDCVARGIESRMRRQAC